LFDIKMAHNWMAGFLGADFVVCAQNQEVVRERCGGLRRPWALNATFSFVYAHKRDVHWLVPNVKDRCLIELAHWNDIYAIISTPQGIVTCGEDTRLCLHHSDGKTSVTSIHPSTVKDLAYSNGILYSCGGKGQLHACTVGAASLIPLSCEVIDEEGRLLAVEVFQNHPICISSRGFLQYKGKRQASMADTCPMCLVIDGETNMIYMGNSVGSLEVFQGEDICPSGIWKIHEGAVTSLLLLSDLFTTSDDGTVARWDKATGEKKGAVLGHVASSRALLEIPKDRICSVGWDQRLQIYTLHLEVIQTIQVAVRQPECLAWDDGIIVGGRGLEKLSMW